MRESSRALLIVGSLKKPRSTSKALGSYLLDRLRERGWETEAFHLRPSLYGEEGKGELLAAVIGADLLILAFPLYYFSLPALATRALELIAEDRQQVRPRHTQQFLAISNCGFPEAEHNDVAMGICRTFAEQTGIEWMGGLAMGSGEAAGGEPPKAQGVLHHVARALDLAAEALARGCPVPQEAVDLLAKPLMPRWLYTTVGNLGWRQRAWKNGVLLNLGRRPYEG